MFRLLPEAWCLASLDVAVIRRNATRAIAKSTKKNGITLADGPRANVEEGLTCREKNARAFGLLRNGP